MPFFEKNFFKRNNGSILILVVVIFSFLASFGGILLSFVYSRYIQYQVEGDRVKAMYLAEAGVSYSIWELKMKKDLDKNGLGNVSKHKLGDGYFQVYHNPETKEIVSTGTYNDISRTIVVIYDSN